jgi:hypothetical protein
MRNLIACSVSVALASLLYACGSPSSPSVPTVGANVVAVVAVTSIAATSETTATGFLYHVSYQLRETSGRSAATFSSLAYSFSNGGSTDGALNGAVKIAAGGAFDVGPINITDNTGRAIATSVTVTGAFTDDNGRGGNASGTGAITAPIPSPQPAQTYMVSGTVTDGTSHGILPNIQIDFSDGSGNSKTTTTSVSGSFVLSGIGKGAYTLTASAVSYQTISQAVIVSSSDVRADVVLPRSGSPSPSQTLTCNGVIVPATVSCPNNQGIKPPTAMCNDGSFSCSQNRSGTCSSHAGVQCYVCPGQLC